MSMYMYVQRSYYNNNTTLYVHTPSGLPALSPIHPVMGTISSPIYLLSSPQSIYTTNKDSVCLIPSTNRLGQKNPQQKK